MAEARPLLGPVLAARIGFTPTADRGYELNVPIEFDRVLTAVIPRLETLQESNGGVKGNRTYVDAKTSGKSSSFGLILLSRITEV